MRAISIALIVAFLSHLSPLSGQGSSPKPLRVGVVGLVHTHVHWILGRPDRGDIEIVGIAEPNRDLAQRYAEQHGYSMDIVFDTMEEMIAATNPEAVTAFNTIYDHLRVVEVAAPRGIHVMVEKPLAVSLEHARQMQALAQQYGIHLLTNYETTWYPSVHAAKAMVDAGELGPLRKVVVHDGHPGPAEIGVNEEFLEWLTDPVLNGGGALTDFGCYGANLVTWLMGNERPLTVTAVTQQMKPDRYPKVEDEATIVVTYPKAQGIIQASWNWPVSRKDMEVYGSTGQLFADNATDMRIRLGDGDVGTARTAPPLDAPVNDPFTYLEAVVRGRVDPGGDLSSLANNMIVMEILDAAKQSAQTGRTVIVNR
jgi:scyllo-inositol 2-dehydrogenase (NADP+)